MRTREQALHAEPAVVVLGGREFRVRPQKKGVSKNFRHRLGELLSSLNGINDVIKTAMESARYFLSKDKDANPLQIDALPIDGLASAVIQLIYTTGDDLMDMIFEYDPEIGFAELECDNIDFVKDWVNTNAYDTECVKALVTIFRMCFGPFVSALPFELDKATSGNDNADGKKTGA